MKAKDEASKDIQISKRKLLDWLLTGGTAAVLVGFAWMWPPLGLVACGLVAIAIALRCSRVN